MVSKNSPVAPNHASVSFHKEIPISSRYDVVVIGGGIAGVCAACAAAYEGANTLLVERFAKLGGNATSGGVDGFCGETWGQGHVFDEILADLEKFDAIVPHFYAKDVFFKGRRFDHEILAVILQEVTLRHRVKVLVHTRFVDVILSGNTITHVIIAGKSGLEAIEAGYVIDCSGEADVARAAGCATLKGRENDGLQLPMSLMYFLREVPLFKKIHKVKADYFDWKPFKGLSDLPMTSFGRNSPHGRSVKIKIPGYDSTNTESLSAAEIQGHRKMMQVLEFYQRFMHQRWELDYCASIIGIREGCRIKGMYTLTLEDVRAGREFEDVIAVGCYPLDAHKPDDDKRTYILPKKDLAVPPYHIPLRCIIANDMDNLLGAGRNISADQMALSSARVMTTCAMIGTAAGTTTATCIQLHKNPKEIVRESPDLIQNKLKKGGMVFERDFYGYLEKFQDGKTLTK